MGGAVDSTDSTVVTYGRVHTRVQGYFGIHTGLILYGKCSPSLGKHMWEVYPDLTPPPSTLHPLHYTLFERASLDFKLVGWK